MRTSLSIEASHSNQLFACNYQIQIASRAANLRAAQRTRKSTFPKINGTRYELQIASCISQPVVLLAPVIERRLRSRSARNGRVRPAIERALILDAVDPANFPCLSVANMDVMTTVIMLEGGICQ
jgi:hypothetical protein